MIIEEEIFKKSEVDFNKAKKYGFKIKLPTIPKIVVEDTIDIKALKTVVLNIIRTNIK